MCSLVCSVVCLVVFCIGIGLALGLVLVLLLVFYVDIHVVCPLNGNEKAISQILHGNKQQLDDSSQPALYTSM